MFAGLRECSPVQQIYKTILAAASDGIYKIMPAPNRAGITGFISLFRMLETEVNTNSSVVCVADVI